MTITATLTAKAREIGFDAIGIAPVALGAREQTRLDAFLAGGEHGDMAWMAETQDRRRSPTALWSSVRSVVVLGTNYGPDQDPMQRLADPLLANVSCYARNRDYHDLIKKRLKQLARWMVAEMGGDVKVFVDTAPVMEKPLAALAGMGWQGKHSNLVSREFGSWLFLGEIYTTLDLPQDAVQEDRCGSCRSCLDICPTNAFPAPYHLDARRCLSYLSIEHKGPIPRQYRQAMGNRIYGCDDCLAVCPWNKFAVPTREPWFLERPVLKDTPLGAYLDWDDATFRTAFSGSPVKRIGRDRFLRNVLVACGNSGVVDLVPAVLGRLQDPSPLIRGAAVWALGMLDPQRAAEERSRYLEREEDPGVLAEWHDLP